MNQVHESETCDSWTKAACALRNLQQSIILVLENPIRWTALRPLNHLHEISIQDVATPREITRTGAETKPHYQRYLCPQSFRAPLEQAALGQVCQRKAGSDSKSRYIGGSTFLEIAKNHRVHQLEQLQKWKLQRTLYCTDKKSME